ncbi:hypothetical protein KC952_00215 [Candidatus Saccharibacteria bacterium]|nr:hypothetical protein [Candidatus Saccharibacteria bacterium]
MKKITAILTKKLSILACVFGFAGLLTMTTVILPASGVSALNPADSIQDGVQGAGGGSGGESDFKQSIKTVVNTLLFILGAIAVIMIVVGGIRYTTSDGDSSKIKQSKDTILYAVIGIIVALLAYAIVNFIIAQFK